MQLLRLGAVTGQTGLSRSTIYYLIGKGEFPRPICVGARAVAWVADEVDQWIEGRIQRGRSPAGQTARTRVPTSEPESTGAHPASQMEATTPQPGRGAEAGEG